MRPPITTAKCALLTLVATLILSAPSSALAPEYKFKVTNKTSASIINMLASEDGKNWGLFEIGKPLAPGKSVMLVWDKSTDNSNCEWYFTAQFEDEDISEPVKFDFCEDELELVFTEK